MRGSVRAAFCGWVLLSMMCCGLLIEIPNSPGILYCPEFENQVLTAEESPCIRFDFAVDKMSVEALFAVKDAGGAVQGEYRWDGPRVYFHARPELIVGRRYLFSFSGSFHDTKGIEYSVHRLTPFYYCRKEETPPYLAGSIPQSGQAIACGSPIRIVFSKEIDTATLGRGLSVEPETDVASTWENGNTELVLAAREGWHNCCRYTIELGEEIQDLFGVPLAEPAELVYWVQEDVDPPRVLSITPVYNRPAELYPPTGRGMGQAVCLDDALLIAFSEPMDCDSTAGALVVHPPLSYSSPWLDAATLVLVPANGFAPSTEYLLDLDAAAMDAAGNSIDFSGPLGFVTVSGAITVSTELVNDGILLSPGDYSTLTAVEIEPYPITTAADYLMSFSFAGAAFDSNAEKLTAQRSICLECLLPDSGVADPIATGFSWTGDRDLSITFSALQFSTVAGRVYYLLRIRGGPAGIGTEDGHRLERDLEQLLVAKAQQEVQE